MHIKVLFQVAAGFLSACSLPGCYTGLEGPHFNAQGDGSADGTDNADGADGASDGGDGTDPAPADDGPPEDPFVVPGEEVVMLPFPVRMNNLSAVTGAELTNPIFFELYDLRFQLGDHDFSNLQAPDLRWSPQKMQNWVKGLIPVCDSAVMQARYPDLIADPAPLIQAAFGRDPLPTELEPLQEIASSTQDDAVKYRLSCLTVLSSLEFVAS